MKLRTHTLTHTEREADGEAGRQTSRQRDRQTTACEVLAGHDCLVLTAAAAAGECWLAVVQQLIGAEDVLSRRRHLNSTVMPRLRANASRERLSPSLSPQTRREKLNLNHTVQ